MSVKTNALGANPGFMRPHLRWGRRAVSFEFGLGATPQTVAVGDITNAVPVITPGLFRRWTINAIEAPTGSDLIVDIYIDGDSIFGVGAASSAKVVLPAGETNLVEGSTFAAIEEIPEAFLNGLLRAEILQVGSTNSGVGVTVTLEWGND